MGGPAAGAVPRIAGPDDVGVVARLHARGFATDPVIGWVFQGPTVVDKLEVFFRFIAGEGTVPLGASWVVDHGCACWTPPAPEPWPEEREARFTAALGGVCGPGDLERLAALGAAADAHRPAEPHWYLSSIAVDPSRQGTGIGSLLLARGLARVDAEGLPAFLESTNPRNVPLYERFGFCVSAEVEIAGGPVMSAMWREASAG